MKFDDYRISPELKANIDKLGYKKPTDIQFKSIPAILKGEDVLAIAQTGTGKTASFAIPIINHIQLAKRKSRYDGIRCLVMAPTHELAQQIDKVFYQLTFQTKVTTFCIHGGVDQEPQIRKLNNGIDILVSTPGRVFDLIHQGFLRLDSVEILVLDEADHMLDLGFIKDIRDLIRHLPKDRQTLFFSATIDENIKKLAYSLVKNAIRIQISPKDPVAKNISHYLAKIEQDDKRFFLESVIKNNPERKILVFVRTKVRAERVKAAMARVGLISDSIHSDRTQDERKSVMNDFRTSELKVLIATDVSARGIDIPNVDLVINYDLPDSGEQYVHRVGRTGRGREKGLAISFCSKEELELLAIIEEKLGNPIEEYQISKDEYQYTIAVTDDRPNDWKALLKEAEKQEKEIEALRKKRRKKK
jgi:ATP-dependent RNA helicase RhlE